METPNNKSLRVIRPDILWAKKKLEDVLFGCHLNIKLHGAGICPLLIVDMDEQDILEYTKFLEHVFTR
jgi:hypothetical protein